MNNILLEKEGSLKMLQKTPTIHIRLYVFFYINKSYTYICYETEKHLLNK